MTRSIIIHADLNSFFATAEQQINPALRGRPVGVVKAKGRSCIIAASVEAKKLGIGTGSTVWDAKKVCPDIILVPADFDKYFDMSRRFIKICQDFSPACEVFSLDECFIDVSETEKFWGNVFNIAFEIKRRLRQEVGDYMTCSVGVSHNRLLAKLASDQIKPDGLFWITEDNMLEILDKSDLMDICGIGWGLNRHLRALGIDSFPKLRNCSFEFLHDNFGPYWSVHLYNICRGIDQTKLLGFRNVPEAKSVGRTYTTHKLLKTRAEAEKLVRNLCEEATYKARQMGLAGRYVSLSLREGSEGKAFWGHETLKNFIWDGKIMFDICRSIAKNWNFGPIIFCGVMLGMLTKDKYLPMPLFLKDQKRSSLVSSMDKVNDKFGDYTVFPAKLASMDIIVPEVTGYFGDRSYQLKRFKALE